MSKITDIERWRQEIALAEDLRNKEFGEYTQNSRTLSGENIDYFEKGFSIINTSVPNDLITTLNIVHAIVKNIVPSLYYQNPRVLCFPKKIDSEETAPIVSEISNYYFKKTNAEDVNKKVIWDAYVLGHGYSKIGYATKIGTDIEDEKKKKKSFLDKSLEQLGLKKKEEEEIVYPDINYNIVSESPFISYVSPFNFIRDPRSLTMEESLWVGQSFKRTVKQVKENKKYKNTSKLVGSEPDLPLDSLRNMSQSELEDFRTIDLYEINYRNSNTCYLLVLAKDNDSYKELYHEESIYQIDGWQFEELTFNKHGHKSFAKSDITKIKLLQDRLTSTIDVILEQVDKFTPKIAYNDSDLTQEGKLSLQTGGVGALIATTKNPDEVFKELNFTQLKGDLKVLIDQLIDLITIQTGLTRTQLTGQATGNSATEATIAQGGQTLRQSDMAQSVRRYTNSQAQKLWQVIRQFVDLEELQLINGVNGIDQTTGFPKYNWITIDANRSLKMQMGEYDFDIEVGSTEKPDLGVIRKQFENLFSILARTDVITLMQQQGDKVVLSELLRMYLNLFPEAVKDIGKIIQKINENTTGLVANPDMGPGGNNAGSQFNALEAQQSQQIPNQQNLMGSGRSTY